MGERKREREKGQKYTRAEEGRRVTESKVEEATIVDRYIKQVDLYLR